MTFIAFLILEAAHLVIGKVAVGVILPNLLTTGVGSLNSGGINFFVLSLFVCYFFFGKRVTQKTAGKRIPPVFRSVP